MPVPWPVRRALAVPGRRPSTPSPGIAQASSRRPRRGRVASALRIMVPPRHRLHVIAAHVAGAPAPPPVMRWTQTKEQAGEQWTLVNGELMQEKDVKLSRQDADGFIHGCFDTTRTFAGVPFRVSEHVDRLFATMKFLDIASPYTHAELVEMNHRVLEANRALVEAVGDVWITTKICPVGFHPEADSAANCLVAVDPLPFAARTAAFRHGIVAQVSSVPRAAPEAMSPRVKANANYLNLQMAEREVQAANPAAAVLQLSHDGNLCEGNGANVFIVQAGIVRTPPRRMVLAGISRDVTIELCAKLSIPCEETIIDMYDVYGADEAFITSTSWAICGIREINGRTVGGSTQQQPHGPVTSKLMAAYSELVACDYVAQYTEA